MCTFVIEAIDEWESWKKPMLIAIGQSLSVFCGLVLPLISSSKTVWTMTLFLSCALHSIMFVRIWQKTTKLEVMEVSEGPASFTARRTGLSLSLHRLAAVVWTLFAVVYFVDYGVRAYLLSNPMLATRGIIEKFSGTDWAMVFDCIIDVFAKMMLSSSIGEGMPLSMAASVPMPWLMCTCAAADSHMFFVPVLLEHESLMAMDERLSVVCETIRTRTPVAEAMPT